MATHRRPRFRLPGARKRDAERHLAAAEQAASTAAMALSDQRRKLAEEQPLHHRIDKLMDDNHLSALLWFIVGG